MERKRADLDDDGNEPDLDALIEAAQMNAETEWEIDFCADMRGRYERYGDRTIVSENQLAKLRDIAEGRGGRRGR